MADDYFILNCSFGKDSMAMLKTCVDKGYPIDEVCYIKIMYDKGISAEYPAHYQFIQDVGIPYITEKLGLKYHELNPKSTLKDLFFKVFQKGAYTGKHYGFPQRHCVKCNSELKIRTLKLFHTELREKDLKPVHYVGIAADEQKRVLRGKYYGYLMPLADLHITERDAMRICMENGILSPLYECDCFNRIGCFFCPNCTIPQLRYLYRTSPELLKDLADLDKYSPFKFHSPHTATQLLRKFESEAREQTKLSDFIGRGD